MDDQLRRVSVVGLGYVGLPTAAVLAANGIEVIGVDVDPGRIATVNSGATPIIEPDLDTLVRDAVASGRLSAGRDIAAADAFIIAVPTPLDDGHRPDLRQLRNAAKTVAQVLQPGNLVVLESTSPVGTTELLCEWLAEARPDLSFPHIDGGASDIRVAYSPERVLPGQILVELVENERIVGGITDLCTRLATNLYRIFVRGEISMTNARTAELAKLAENAFRDVNIAFANEISRVSEALGVNQWEVIEHANRHPRVNILRPGPGVGGHCVAIDPWFLIHSVPDSTPLLKAARTVNDARPKAVVDQVVAACEGRESPVLACLGLAYKANVNDLRESPSVSVVEQPCTNLDGRIPVVEPHIDALQIACNVMDALS